MYVGYNLFAFRFINNGFIFDCTEKWWTAMVWLNHWFESLNLWCFFLINFVTFIIFLLHEWMMFMIIYRIICFIEQHVLHKASDFYKKSYRTMVTIFMYSIYIQKGYVVIVVCVLLIAIYLIHHDSSFDNNNIQIHDCCSWTTDGEMPAPSKRHSMEKRSKIHNM